MNETLEQMGGFQPAVEATPLDQLKLAITGLPKGGKSRLASTCRKPALMYDWDGRAASVAGVEGLYVKTLQDVNPMVPKAFSTFTADIGQLEYVKSQKKELPCKTIILDSMKYMSQAAMYQSMSSTKGASIITVGGAKFPIPRGYDNYEGEYNLVVNSLLRLFYLGCDVIAVFHERPEEAKDSTQDNPKFTGNLSVDPPRLAKYLPLFNEQWRVSPNNSTYEVRTKPGYAGVYNFLGATCLNLDEIEKPNIEAMITKHLSKGSR